MIRDLKKIKKRLCQSQEYDSRSSTTSSLKTAGRPWSTCLGVTSPDFSQYQRMRFICVTDTVVAAWMMLVSSHFMKYSIISSRTSPYSFRFDYNPKPKGNRTLVGWDNQTESKRRKKKSSRTGPYNTDTHGKYHSYFRMKWTACCSHQIFFRCVTNLLRLVLLRE